MANNAAGSDDLFQRKATGLVRGWSVWDGFIYAAFSINLITLGLLAFSYAPFIPDGSLILAIILAGLYLVFQTVTYAALIAVMPRAGGDYVWTSRVLGGGIDALTPSSRAPSAKAWSRRSRPAASGSCSMASYKVRAPRHASAGEAPGSAPLPSSSSTTTSSRRPISAPAAASTGGA